MKIKKNISEIPEFFRKYLKLYLQHLKKRINENLLSLILYGSVARDIWNEESDVDLFLILSNEFKKKNTDFDISKFTIEFYNEIYGTELYNKMKNHPLSILSLKKEESKRFRTLFYDIAIDGIILYDPKDIGIGFVEKYKKRINKKNLKRVFVDKNDFYWERGDIKRGDIIEL